jgi:adenylate kinase family enzyme
LAYAPLGGPERAAKLARDPVLKRVAAGHHCASPADVFLAYLLAVRPEIVPVVGARRPQTIGRIAAAERLSLEQRDLELLDARFPTLASVRSPPVVRAREVEVALLMGMPGAGKSRAAHGFVARGYERLNRDAAGGTLRGIGQKLEERLRGGAKRVVLDNTYVTRAARYDVLRIASSHGARVRCVFFDTPQEQAQVNVVLRMLERFGRVVGPEEMGELARTEPAALAPRAISRMTRDLEPPEEDEGFAAIEVVPFVREHPTGGRAGVIIALDALPNHAHRESLLPRIFARWPADTPWLVYTWSPGIDALSIASLREMVDTAGRAAGRPVEMACCPHPGGPSICWCRPPLPAMFLAFAFRHGLDLRRVTFVGTSATDRTVARVLEMSFAELGSIMSL